ncbi:hypothetical protein K7X08_003665 [Anisodus acutangulus]|uniref:Uncharacterized protein n=1 Tax=Anisodus acutangulus TaxID=402998 RepID=A0A9Q1ML30_9SOLA|nr:hypothetical protein K7X08_003665 [Anisodus acutangulus]
MSADEILTTVLGERTGYVRGKGHEKSAPNKLCETEEREEMAAELQRKLEEQVASELHKLEEERAHMNTIVDKRILVKMEYTYD